MGTHLTTGAEWIGIRKTQEVSSEKAPKKDPGKRKDISKAMKESSDESEVYVDITDDDEVEIFEVEM